MTKMVCQRCLLALVAGVFVLSTAMVLLAPQPASATEVCEDCYEKFFVFVGSRAFCCSDTACDSWKSAGYLRKLTNVKDCGTRPGPTGKGSYCNLNGTSCSSSGSGGSGGGGGGGGGDECVIGPGDPYCDASCSACTWDPMLF